MNKIISIQSKNERINYKNLYRKRVEELNDDRPMILDKHHSALRSSLEERILHQLATPIND